MNMDQLTANLAAYTLEKAGVLPMAALGQLGATSLPLLKTLGTAAAMQGAADLTSRGISKALDRPRPGGGYGPMTPSPTRQVAPEDPGGGYGPENPYSRDRADPGLSPDVDDQEPWWVHPAQGGSPGGGFKMGSARKLLQKIAGDMPSFTAQDRPKKVKEIYRALKRDHPEMPAGMKARIAARQGKPGKQKQGPPYKGPLSAKKKENGGYKEANYGEFGGGYGPGDTSPRRPEPDWIYSPGHAAKDILLGLPAHVREGALGLGALGAGIGALRSGDPGGGFTRGAGMGVGGALGGSLGGLGGLGLHALAQHYAPNHPLTNLAVLAPALGAGLGTVGGAVKGYRYGGRKRKEYEERDKQAAARLDGNLLDILAMKMDAADKEAAAHYPFSKPARPR